MPTTKRRSAARRNFKKTAGAATARKTPRRLPKKKQTTTGAAGGREASNVKQRVKQILFVQGGGRDVHDSWDDKLVASLKQTLGAGYTIRYPRMPDEADPDPVAWKKVIARELGKLSDGAILVGHSVGAAILIDHLGDGNPARPLAGTFLIAPPFIGDGGWPSDDLRPTKELGADLPEGAPLYIYQGSNDETVPVSHIGMFTKAFPHATIRRFEGRDHQLNDDLSEVAHDIKRLR